MRVFTILFEEEQTGGDVEKAYTVSFNTNGGSAVASQTVPFPQNPV